MNNEQIEPIKALAANKIIAYFGPNLGSLGVEIQISPAIKPIIAPKI